MSVYVDDSLTEWRPGKRCHLTADSTEELHEFAARIGLDRGDRFRLGFNNRDAFDRYEITAAERDRAIKAGAVAEAWQDGAHRKLERTREALYADADALMGATG